MRPVSNNSFPNIQSKGEVFRIPSEQREINRIAAEVLKQAPTSIAPMLPFLPDDISKSGDLAQMHAFLHSIEMPIHFHLDIIAQSTLSPLLRKYQAQPNRSNLQKIEHQINLFCFHSEAQLVISFLKGMIDKLEDPLLKQLLKNQLVSFHAWAPLIARCNLPEFNQEIKSSYMSADVPGDFYALQKEFGLNAFIQVHNIVRELREDEIPLNIIFKRLATWRFSIAEERGDENAMNYTLIRNDPSFLPNWKKENMWTTLQGRYQIYTPLIEETNQKRESTKNVEGIRFFAEKAYVLEYFSERTRKKYPLTICHFNEKERCWEWVHTDPKLIADLWQDFALLHKQVYNFKLNLQDPKKSLAALEKLVAKAFWLGTNITRTARGNAQYMMIMLSIWYRYHHFNPPLMSIKNPLPDCIALSMPMNQFIEQFHAMFNVQPEKD